MWKVFLSNGNTVFFTSRRIAIASCRLTWPKCKVIAMDDEMLNCEIQSENGMVAQISQQAVGDQAIRME